MPHLTKLTCLLALAVAPALSQTTTWVQHPEVAPRSQTRATFDAARGCVVCIGGFVYNAPTNETIEWDGTAWVSRSPRTSPPAMTSHSLTYDAARRRVVLFGGSGLGNEVWLWDGRDWEQRAPAIAPPRRLDCALAYDPIRQRVVAFGGSSSGGLLGDTWEWDGSAWSANTSTVRPAARYSHGLAWDPISQRVILFGGRDQSGDRSDTWAFDGTGWVQLSPTVAPAGAVDAMSTDPTRGQIVLLVRTTSGGSVIMQTWEWTGTTWVRVPTTASPFPGLPGFAADGTGGMLAAFSGGADAPDTWRYDGTDWARVDMRFDSTVSASAAASDVDRRRVVSFGGSAGRSVFNTWEWDGHRWYGFAPANGPSSALSGTRLVYDRARRRTLLFGGGTTSGAFTPNDNLWEWDGNNWLLRTPSVRPNPRFACGLAYDVARGRTVMFGGRGSGSVPLNDTWEWDGASWAQRFPSNQPSPQAVSAMAYDEVRQRVVLFGGASPVSDTWEWDGNNWSQLNPATSPSTSAFQAMAWDPARRRVVLAMWSPTLAGTDLWEWDGNDWTALASAQAVHQFGVFSADPLRQRLLLGNQVGDIFVAGRSPAAMLETGTGCAGSAGIPLLYARGLPSLANAEFRLELAGGRANAAAVVLLSLGPASIGFGPCTLLVGSPVVSLPVSTSSNGFAALPLPIPPLHGLVGGTLWGQGFVLDPLGAFAGALAATNGVGLTVGD